MQDADWSGSRTSDVSNRLTAPLIGLVSLVAHIGRRIIGRKEEDHIILA